MNIFKKNENFMRKLHSLSGVLPLGIFLPFHLCLNFTSLWGQETYDVAAGFLGKIPFIWVVEWVVIFIPILFHGIYGFYIARQAKNNVSQFNYARNWFFFLQRLTGIIAFLFICWHVWETRIQVALGLGHPSWSMMSEIVASPLSLILYLIGIVSAVYHLFNGIWTFLITWGITVSPKSQKVSRFITTAGFFAFSIVGVLAILAFV